MIFSCSPPGLGGVVRGELPDPGDDLGDAAVQDVLGPGDHPVLHRRVAGLVEAPGGLPQVFQHVDEIDQDGHGDAAAGGLAKPAFLRMRPRYGNSCRSLQRVACPLTSSHYRLIIHLILFSARAPPCHPRLPPPPPRRQGSTARSPPSGTHIVKLFVVPLLIVGGLLLGSFLFLRLTGGSVVRTPQGFLADLRSGNDDVRKRAASDLAQLLLRDDQLASDPHFGLDLAGELPQAVADADRDQASTGRPVGGRVFAGQRQLPLLPHACVSHLSTPVGCRN